MDRKPDRNSDRKPAWKKREEDALRLLGVFLEECTTTGRSIWVPPGETIAIGPYTIPGMVYVGDGLISLSLDPTIGPQIDPCLIRPKSPIDAENPDTEGKLLRQLSYTQLKPASRAAYLAWHATDRASKPIAAPYLELFLYGLERRVLHDLFPIELNTTHLNELDRIIAELDRLRLHYLELLPDLPWQISLRDRLEQFLTICRSIQLRNANAPKLYTTIDCTFELALGQLIAEQQPVSAEWAIAWVTQTQADNSVLQAFPKQFSSLFQLYFTDRFGETLKLTPKTLGKTITYTPANPSFGNVPIAIDLPQIPDLTQFSDVLTQLQKIVTTCTEELKPLSRATPKPQLQDWLQQSLNTRSSIVIPVVELLRHWLSGSSGKPTKREVISLAQSLEYLGYGLEPDPRYHSSFKSDRSVAIFNLPRHSKPPSIAFEKATTYAQIAIVVLSEDGKLSTIEEQFLRKKLENHLLNDEHARLQAHITGLLSEKPTLRTLKSRLKTIDLQHRPKLARFLVEVAFADGPLVPKEVQRLEKAYELLELETKTVYADIHDVSTTIKTSAQLKPFAQLKPSATLDMSLVRSKLQESEEIAAVLETIFVDEEPAQQYVSPSIVGLDAAHSALLIALAQSITWQRSQLEAIALPLNLMLDGALEVINDVAFDRCDEAVIEGDETYEVNSDVLRELLK